MPGFVRGDFFFISHFTRCLKQIQVWNQMWLLMWLLHVCSVWSANLADEATGWKTIWLQRLDTQLSVEISWGLNFLFATSICHSFGPQAHSWCQEMRSHVAHDSVDHWAYFVEIKGWQLATPWPTLCGGRTCLWVSFTCAPTYWAMVSRWWSSGEMIARTPLE